MVWVGGADTLVGAYLDPTFPAKARLLAATLDTVAVPHPYQLRWSRKRPDQLNAGRGYDSNVARALLVRRGSEPIIPARTDNQRATHQDGRKLRRYRRRWIVERTIGWLGSFRRLTVRYDRPIETYCGFFHLACALITSHKVFTDF